MDRNKYLHCESSSEVSRLYNIAARGWKPFCHFISLSALPGNRVFVMRFSRFVCLSVCVCDICLSVSLSVSLSVCLFVSFSISYIYLFIYIVCVKCFQHCLLFYEPSLMILCPFFLFLAVFTGKRYCMLIC